MKLTKELLNGFYEYDVLRYNNTPELHNIEFDKIIKIKSSDRHFDYFIKEFIRKHHKLLNIKELVTHEPYSTLTYTYDKDRTIVKSYTSGCKVKYTYDDKGRILTYTKPNGAMDVWEYDKDGNLLTEPHKYGIKKYTYDDNGNMITSSYKDEYRDWDTTCYSYDDKGNKLKETSSRGGVKRFTYNDNGDMLTRSYVIDNDNTDGKNYIVCTYDDNGNILTCDEGGIHTDYTYNDKGQLVSEKRTNGWYGLDYEYDDKGNKIKTTNTKTGGVEEFTYGDYGLLSQNGGQSGYMKYAYDMTKIEFIYEV